MLNRDELLSSPIVANATMNRGRGLSGVNSYERELRFDIAGFLEARVRERGATVWYDACCGQGHALLEAGKQFAEADWGRRIQLIGVDLVEMFLPEQAPGVQLLSADVGTFTLDRPADLITCVHGLHYLGDKLGFLQNAYAALAPGGLLLAHLDTQNFRLMGKGSAVWGRAARHVRKIGACPELKNHVLCVPRTEAPLDFGMAYQGATVSEQPNYTGITVIDSWYATR